MSFWKSVPRPFFIFILLLYGATFFFFLYRGTPLTRDSTEYEFAAQNLLRNGHWYAGDPVTWADPERIDFRLFSKRPPGYPLFLLIFSHPVLLLLAQILASLLGIWLGYRIMLKDKSTPRSTSFWRIAACALLLSPAQFYYSGFVMSDLLLQTFVLLCLFFYGKWHDEKRSKWLWASSLSICTALLLKPVVLPLAFVLGAVALMLAIRNKRLFYLIYGLPLLVWAGISLQNQSYSGKFEYSSIGAINTVQYNGRVVLSRVWGADSAEKMLEPYMFIPRSKQAYEHWKTQSNALGKQVLKDHPLSYIKFHLLGSLRMPLDPGRFEWALLKGDPQAEEGGFLNAFSSGGWKGLLLQLRQNPLVFLLILLMAANGLRFLFFLWNAWTSRRNHLHVMATLFIVYFILIAGPIGASRFLLPVLPLIIWGAVAGAEEVMNRFWPGGYIIE
jgi:uncharacterized membrane protein SpoIIM required for sporulation